MLLKIKEIEYADDKLLGEGWFGAVYKGRCSSYQGEIAVKKVKIDYIDQETKEDELKNLNHPNVVRLFDTASDNSYRYYALELCETSMDRIFPEPPNKKSKYENDILSSSLKSEDALLKLQLLSSLNPEDALLQLASGLAYIHSSSSGIGSDETNRKPLVHRDVKPSNVLISIKENKVTFKWGDFGLCKNASEDRETFTLSGVRGTEFWIAPEVMEMDKTKEKTKGSTRSDVWAAGCVFFYYLTQGQHPFGRINNKYDTDITLKNIKEGHPSRLNELRFDHFARQTIEKMIQKNPKDRIKSWAIANELKPVNQLVRRVSYEKQNGATRLNSSSLLDRNRCTYSGKFKEMATGVMTGVAVKRICSENADPDLGWNFARLYDHSNVIKLLFAERDDEFTYFAFELCAGSMNQIFLRDDHPRKYRGPLPSDGDVLVSLIQGLAYIHSQGLIHGRIQPEKALISATEPVIMKWGHFGIENGPSQLKSYNAFAPEMLNNEDKPDADDIPVKYRGKSTDKNDIWCAGGVFYFFLSLSRGVDRTQGSSNPILFIPSDLVKKTFEDLPYFSRKVIKNMLAINPDERIKLEPDALKLLNENIEKEKECRDLCSKQNVNKEDEFRLHQVIFENKEIDLDGLDAQNRIGLQKTQRTNLSLLCQNEKLTETHLNMIRSLLQGFKERNNDKPKHDSDGTNPLFWLFQHRRTESLLGIVTSMLDIGINSNDMDPSTKKTILHSVCENYKNEDMIQMIRLLMTEEKMDAGSYYLNKDDSQRRTAIHHLCKNYNNTNLVNIIEFLIENEVNVKAENIFENTGLHWLCESYPHYDNLKKIIELLIIKGGANVNAVDWYGSTMLHRLSLNEKLESMIDVVQFLIERGVNLNDSGPQGESTLLAFCEKYKKEDLIDIIKLLVKNGAILNAKNTLGDSALDYVCECYRNKNLLTVMEYLIDNRVDIKLNGIGGRTTVQWLCQDYPYKNLYDIIKLLIDEKGLDVTVQDSEGYTALDLLSRNDIHHLDDCELENVKKLLTSNVDTRQSSQIYEEENRLWELCSSVTPMTEENSYRLCDIFKARSLLNSCFRRAESASRTPLSLLCQSRAAGSNEHHFRAIQSFLETYRCRVVRPANDSDGTNALYWLFQRCEITESMSEIVQNMIEIGINVNAVDPNGRTTFHSICENYRNEDLIQIIEFLMGKNVTLNIEDSERRTILHFYSLGGETSSGKTSLHLLCANYGNENLISILQLFFEYAPVLFTIEDNDGETALHYLKENYKGENMNDIIQLYCKYSEMLPTSQNNDEDSHIPATLSSETVEKSPTTPIPQFDECLAPSNLQQHQRFHYFISFLTNNFSIKDWVIAILILFIAYLLMCYKK